MNKISWKEKIMLIAGSLAASLFLAELVLMFFFKTSPESKSMPKVLVHEASSNLNLLYRPSPNASAEAYGVQNKINSLGFRDREYQIPKPKGIHRMVFLGDSVVYGYGLELDYTIPKQLEKRFQKNKDPVEVLNLGVSGYETSQAVEFFKELGFALQPDTVLVGYTLNDSLYASMELDFFEDQKHWRISSEEYSWDKKVLRFLYRFSNVFQFLDRKCRFFEKKPKLQDALRGKKSIWHFIRDRNAKIEDLPDSEYRRLKVTILEDAKRYNCLPQNTQAMLNFVGFDNYVMRSSHWNVSEKAFWELRHYASKYGFQVVVVIFPYMWDIEHYVLGSLHLFLRQKLEAMGFRVIDLLDFCQSLYRKYDRGFTIDPIHFSPLGTEKIADVLYDELKNSDSSFSGSHSSPN